jgi:hypothetical protein
VGISLRGYESNTVCELSHRHESLETASGVGAWPGGLFMIRHACGLRFPDEVALCLISKDGEEMGDELTVSRYCSTVHQGRHGVIFRARVV